MPRLVVSNLPRDATREEIERHFTRPWDGQGGSGSAATTTLPTQFTDLQIRRKKNGGGAGLVVFLGVKTRDEAEAVRRNFHRTYLRHARLDVREAEAPGVGEGAEGVTGARKLVKPGGQTLSTSTTPSNDSAATITDGQADHDADPDPNRLPTPSQDRAETEAMTDLEYMRSRMRRIKEDDGRSVEVKGEDKPCQPASQPQPRLQAPEVSIEEQILATGRLFLRNLAFTCTLEDLHAAFEPFGKIQEITLPLSRETKTPKGIAIVTFALNEHALQAWTAMDRRDFQGRLLHILPGAEPRNPVKSGGLTSVKASKKDERRKEAGKEFKWSELYMNSDAVLSSVAERLGVSKSELLDPHSSDAAVKLAIAETHVIEESRNFLQEHGVDLEAFAKGDRSDRVILIKNFTFGTTEKDLDELFSRHAKILRIVMVPARTFAIVELATAAEAKVAFQKLAYKRLGESVIYLEWAPSTVFKPGLLAKASQPAKPAITIEPAQEDGAVTEPASSLYIKNLAFSTTSQGLSSIFKSFPDFSSAHVQTRADVKVPGQIQSLGYGFAHFSTSEGSARALAAMQGFNLDGHSLLLSYAKRDPDKSSGPGPGPGVQAPALGAKRQTKLLVKNVPFETSRKDIYDLFRAYGSVERVRLPKKLDRSARGFAFVDFTTHGQAQQAMDALRHTHLLGRHLVITWADEGENVEALRSKTSDQFGRDQASHGGKKKRQRLQLEDDEAAA